MKKKYSIILSIIVLVLSFIPNLLQGYKVFADNSTNHKNNIELVNQDNLSVTYDMSENSEGYTWSIHYKIKETKDDTELRLKLSFEHNQKITVIPHKNWEIKNNEVLTSAFMQNSEGSIILNSSKEITKLSLNIQADSKLTKESEDEIIESILGDPEGILYELFIPERSTDSSSSDNTNETSDSSSPDVISKPSDSYNTSTSNPITQPSQAEDDEEKNSTTVPETYPSNFSSKSLIKTKLYNNIIPEYTTDSGGTSPTNNWTPTGNTTVINHQGNKDASNNWDSITTWDGDPTNKTTSYIEYGGVKENAEFAMRKYAKETSTPGLYDVYLNVRGNEQKEVKPIDIVLVVDMSGSMEPENNPSGSDRAQATRDGVKEFLQSIQDAGIAQYVNIGLIGFSSPGNYATGANGYLQVSIDSLSNASHVSEINNQLSPKFSGGTFTQLGLRKGAEMLQQDTSGNQKMMILLTDGVPTFSYKVSEAINTNGVIYGTTFNTTRDEPGFTSQLWRQVGQNRVPYSYTATGYTIFNTWAATLGEARNIKAKGIELHTLGIQLGKDIGYTNDNSNTYLTQEQVRARTSLLASTGLYQDAATASDVQKYLRDQANSVVSSFNTIINGTISDPLGTQFNYNGITAELKSVGSSALTSTPTVQMENNELNVTGINLGKNQEIQIHYQVRLNTETSDFIPEHWYQMNGRTILTPNSNNPNNKVDFGVPSAKGLGVTLNLNKIWEEYDGDTSIRPENVTFEIQRSETTISDAWQKGFVNISGSNSQSTWYQNVKQLSEQQGGAPSLWLPKYNAIGQEMKYVIANEISVPGYESTKVNDTTYKNIKQFIPLALEVTKEDGLGNKLSGATFKLTDEKGNEVVGSTDATGAIFKYSDLKVGKYNLQEVEAPGGYVILKKNIVVDILADGTVKVDDETIKIEDRTIKITVDNQKLGSLPETGGSGYLIYWITSSVILMLFITTGGYYILRKRR
ncbi:VWA domain-containing protein [Lactococcus formosensis]|uniref:VWA domain-containing protein n=2 Tax=Lactococcus formosensis TaxID=1281486 RepID=A0A9X4P1H6_9LACT|nr:SpaA isopeptide-forming pilin-related protein [Lactococcus formosensis]MDG6111537.1 VWA domain-containing protein [Lactococcus formosensis]MDG6117737.1 VWA domain-containing protein [Lactococcus formosensis]MDG6139691.1 VWA domain-containing protein [Lactococcus formosensis]MDG6146168.1 VWA domain-containing protein [Lactococcus formosensis]MDG6153306.1 VWA domain-containing protein [Lactococcus formosensis]